ncbi:MAG: helix-turn-helix transcriptional regulator [Candidatus Heimdallarchaeaceae archaeon]
MKNRAISLVFVSFIILIFLQLTTTSAKQISSIKDFELQQTKETAISKVELVVNTYLLIGKVNLTIEYIQVEENATRFVDSVSFKGNMTNIVVIDSSENDLLISSNYDVVSDTTYVVFQLQRTLNVGEKYRVLVFGILPTIEQVQNRIFECSINWTQTVSVFSATVYLEKYLILLSSSPPPQTTSVIDQRIKMTWDTIMIEKFDLHLEFKASLVFNVIEVSPLIWNVGNVSRSSKPIKQKYVIENLLDAYLKVEVNNPNSWLQLENSFILAPSSKKEIIAELDVSKVGKYESIIIFSTNVSLEEVVCEISVYVEGTLSPWTVAGLVIGFSLIALGVLAFFLYSQLKPVEEVIEEKRTNEKIKDIKIHKLEGFLNENEILIVKEVINNPGISQAQIVRNTGISKATLSRVIRKMERKGLIQKKSVGMSHQLYINKESSFLKYAKK